jgi:hypothetical protein
MDSTLTKSDKHVFHRDGKIEACVRLADVSEQTDRPIDNSNHAFANRLVNESNGSLSF